MKQSWKLVGRSVAVLGIIGIAALLAGCVGEKYQFEQTEGEIVLATNRPAPPRALPTGDEFRQGDTVLITFSGMEPPLPQHTDTIKADGTITPPVVGRSFKAVGKTPSQLQAELYQAYTNYFTHPTIVVQPAIRS